MSNSCFKGCWFFALSQRPPKHQFELWCTKPPARFQRKHLTWMLCDSVIGSNAKQHATGQPSQPVQPSSSAWKKRKHPNMELTSQKMTKHPKNECNTAPPQKRRVIEGPGIYILGWGPNSRQGESEGCECPTCVSGTRRTWKCTRNSPWIFGL